MISCISGKQLALFLQVLSVEPTYLDNGNALMFAGSDHVSIHVWTKTEEIDIEGYYIWCYSKEKAGDPV